jgi:transcription elongation factor Elf1
MTTAITMFNTGFNCPWCGEHQVVNIPIQTPIDVTLGCACGHVYRVTAKQNTVGVGWTVEEVGQP